MKISRYVLKVVALALVAGAAVCCIIAFWDKINQGIITTKEKIRSRRLGCRDDECVIADAEDYADWDE